MVSSDIKEIASKQKLPDHADANEVTLRSFFFLFEECVKISILGIQNFFVCISPQKLYKDLMSWRVKTDKQIEEISNSLTSTQVVTIN